MIIISLLPKSLPPPLSPQHSIHSPIPRRAGFQSQQTLGVPAVLDGIGHHFRERPHATVAVQSNFGRLRHFRHLLHGLGVHAVTSNKNKGQSVFGTFVCFGAKQYVLGHVVARFVAKPLVHVLHFLLRFVL